MQDVFVRTETEDYDQWFRVFSAPSTPTREEYGIHTAGVYRDSENPNTALIHFQVEDMARMQEHLALPDFESTSADAGVTSRSFWLGEPQG